MNSRHYTFYNDILDTVVLWHNSELYHLLFPICYFLFVSCIIHLFKYFHN